VLNLSIVFAAEGDLILQLGEAGATRMCDPAASLKGVASMRTAALIMTVILAAGATEALAECNFDKSVGSCTGNVTITSTGGSSPSYSAELSISSSAGSCSKVEYFIDSTPYTSIIRSGGGSESESVFGSKPVKSADIQVSKCVAYEGGNGTQKDTPDGEVADGGSIEGTWNYATSQTPGTLVLKERKGKVTGKGQFTMVFKMKGYPDVVSLFKVKFTGTRKGNKLTYTETSQIAGHSPSTHSGEWTIDGNTLKRDDGTIVLSR
jgi:hypothetical protein